MPATQSASRIHKADQMIPVSLRKCVNMDAIQVRLGGSVLHISARIRKLLAFTLVCAALLVFCLLIQGHHDQDQFYNTLHSGKGKLEKMPPMLGGNGIINMDMSHDVINRRVNLVSFGGTGILGNAGHVKMAIDALTSATRAEIEHVRMQIYKGTKQSRPSDSIYNFNASLSEVISVDRVIEDTRPGACKTMHYDVTQLPSASIVIPFYNEALSMLLRTVHSILNRTPDSLLNEIILVDDHSTYEYLHQPLARYVDLLPKVRLIRNPGRQGLIVSRMNGARIARGPILIFLDAHTEANEGWLEPLLAELLVHPNHVIQPFVDGIDAGTIDYSTPYQYYHGAFSWDLRYTWLRVPEHVQDQVKERGTPFFSATLVGCALAVDMNYFNKIGSFDEDMKVWGGENIELAWRAWLCGGAVLTIPCSRVGHIFKNFPYKFDGDKDSIVQKNLIRVAETWMDSYKKYFYASTNIYTYKRVNLTKDEWTSLEKRKQLRKDLQCKSFSWYLNEVVPEIEPPPMDAKYYGEIMQLKTRACWEVTEDDYIGMTYMCFEHKIIPRNYFRITSDGLLQHREKCVRMHPPSPMLTVEECPLTASAREEFGIWELISIGNVGGATWGFVSVRKLDKEGRWEKRCVMQVYLY